MKAGASAMLKTDVGRNPRSRCLWFLHPPPCVLHVLPPPFDALGVARLHTLRIACSWFSATRKSWGAV